MDMLRQREFANDPRSFLNDESSTSSYSVVGFENELGEQFLNSPSSKTI